MTYKMSEGPNGNCEFYENYENYENCEKFTRSQRDPMRINKLQVFAKVPRIAYEISEGPNENCEFYENCENYENCEKSQDLRGTQ